MTRAVGLSLGPLAEPRYRLLWTGQAVSALGDSLIPVALAFAVIRAGGTASTLGLVLAASSLARASCLLLGGVWADRLPRHAVMVGADVVRAVCQSAVAALLLGNVAPVPGLFVGAVVYGAATAFFLPASTALVPETVGAGRLQQANALLDLSRSVCKVLGPVVAGVLVVTTTPGVVYAADAATFVVSVACLAQLRLPLSRPRSRTRLLSDLVAGWRQLTGRRWYWLTLCSHALWNFAITAFFVMGPVVASRSPGGASEWGLVFASLGAGSVLGGVAALRWKPGRPMVASSVALALGALQLLALGARVPVLVLMLATAVGFAGLTLANQMWSTTVQQLVPADVLARLSSYDWLISLVVMPLGYAVMGPAAERLGTAPALDVAALLVAVPSLLVLALPGVRGLRRGADGRISQPAVAEEPAS